MQPRSLYDNEPKTIIVDVHEYMGQALTDLWPFHEVVEIVYRLDHLQEKLLDNHSFRIIFILTRWEQPQVEQEIAAFVTQTNNVHDFHVFLIDGGVMVQFNFQNTPIHRCYPITSSIMSTIRDLCSDTTGRHIEFCASHEQNYSRQEDFPIAFMFARLMESSSRINIDYNRRLEREWSLLE